MPRSRKNHSKALGTDRTGRFFRNLGFLKSKQQYAQKKFYLGHDEDAARLACMRLEVLWKCIVEIHERAKEQIESGVLGGDNDGRSGTNFDLKVAQRPDGTLDIRQEVGRPIWTELTLVLAESIRKGEPVARVPLKLIQNLPEMNNIRIDSAFNLVPWLNRTRRQFPVIHIEIDHDQLNAECETILRTKSVELLVEGNRLAAEPLANQKLHHAMDAYIDFVRKNTIAPDGETSEWGKAKIRQIEFIKTHSVDVDLTQLGGPTINAIMVILSNRPITKRGNRCAKRFVRNCFKEFKVFLKWLDKSNRYPWDWPTNFELSAPKIVDTVQEMSPVNRSRKRKLQTYTIPELATLFEYATPIQRAYLLLGLNCGFSNAEMTSLLCEDIFLRQPHPDQDILNLERSGENSWIARERTKTGVLGTWKLWPETVKAIEWWLAQRKSIEDQHGKPGSKNRALLEQATKGRFFITLAGKPVAEKSRRTGRIPNSWNSLVARIRLDQPEFKRLSIKYLRKTGATLVRELSRRELAKVYLSQGMPAGENDEVDAYANLPYQQLFDVLDELHDRLNPLWNAVEDPFPAGRHLGGKDHLSPAKIKKIKTLREKGIAATKIAKEVGVAVSTVYRRSPRAKARTGVQAIIEE